jgi:hypothetical protein
MLLVIVEFCLFCSHAYMLPMMEGMVGHQLLLCRVRRYCGRASYDLLCIVPSLRRDVDGCRVGPSIVPIAASDSFFGSGGLFRSGDRVDDRAWKRVGCVLLLQFSWLA